MKTAQHKDVYQLVADIGGTNARFALVKPDTIGLNYIEILACSNFSGLDYAIEHYLGLCDVDVSQIRQASIAVATPITGNQIAMTNNRWSFSCADLAKKFCWHRLQVLNDFTALALSLPVLADNELEKIGGGQPIDNNPKALIGAGTGLGVSGLIPVGENIWVPLQGEGGHVTCNGTTIPEAEVISRLQQHFGHISAERLLSGPGLENIYQALAEKQTGNVEILTAKEISRNALNDECHICIQTLDFFCAMLGNVAGNLALTLGARGGVYIGGGIVPALGEYFSRSSFRAAFERHGRFSDYLKAIPCYVIRAPFPGLTGAAQVLRLDLPYAGYRVYG